MNFKVKNITPPFLYSKFQKNKFFSKIFSKNKIYKSYGDALQDCTNDAYENFDLIENIYNKTNNFIQDIENKYIPLWNTSAYCLISIINPIIENNMNIINIIDFGGACGAHYFQTRKFIDKKIKLKWFVVETKAMVQKAKTLENEELKFFDNLSDALIKIETIDLLHSSGTVQFVENPENILEEILNCNAKWLILNRLGLNRKNVDIITIHSSKLSWNGIGNYSGLINDIWIKYPCTFLSESKFLKMINNKYEIHAKMEDQSGIFEIEGQEIVGFGLICKLKI